MFALQYFNVSGFLEVVWSRLGGFCFLAVCFPWREAGGGRPTGPTARTRGSVDSTGVV